MARLLYIPTPINMTSVENINWRVDGRMVLNLSLIFVPVYRLEESTFAPHRKLFKIGLLY